MNKVFLDINVMLDMIGAKRPRHNLAIKLLEFLIKQRIKIVISEDCISTIFYIENNKAKVLKFFQQIQYSWIISPFGKKVIAESIDLSQKNNLDLEDVLQCLCAKENNCSVIITSDENFYTCGIKVQTAEMFLEEVGGIKN